MCIRDRENAKRPPLRYFLPTLISVLQSDRQGFTYRMDMILHSDDNPARLQNTSPQTVRRLTDQAGILSQRLEGVGLPERLMSIGLQKGDPDMMTLFFLRHQPFSPDGDEEEGG